MAHASSNLINDWVDYNRGVDKNNYFRAQYGPQLLEHGFLKPKAFQPSIFTRNYPPRYCNKDRDTLIPANEPWFKEQFAPLLNSDIGPLNLRSDSCERVKKSEYLQFQCD